MVFVTNDILLGRFASPERLQQLRECGVTDIVNVSEAPSQLVVSDGPFRAVNWFAIEDRVVIPTPVAVAALDAIHAALIADEGRVYIHCIAGWHRSPTIVWLYLLACGVDRESAQKLICHTAFDAVPGHPLLVSPELVDAIIQHGRDHYLPYSRPCAIKSKVP
jgi:hypothetical protein